MALFEEEHFGKPISEQLSQYIRAYTCKNDRANVSLKTGVGTSIMREVVYRNSSLTKSNSVAIIELMRVAVRNCTLDISKQKKAKGSLEKMLKEV